MSSFANILHWKVPPTSKKVMCKELNVQLLVINLLLHYCFMFLIIFVLYKHHHTSFRLYFPQSSSSRVQTHHRIRVLQSFWVGVAGELGQKHVGHQGVIDGEESQFLSVR